MDDDTKLHQRPCSICGALVSVYGNPAWFSCDDCAHHQRENQACFIDARFLKIDLPAIAKAFATHYCKKATERGEEVVWIAVYKHAQEALEEVMRPEGTNQKP